MIAGLIELKRSDDNGLVAQLTHRLRQLISSGRIGKGSVLPSSRRLAAELAVSRNTVSYAFEQLVAEGYLEMSRGRRAAVAAHIEERLMKGVPGVTSVKNSLTIKQAGQ